MSVQVNGNCNMTKRKKNRDKKHSSTPKINSNEFSIPNFNHFQGNQLSSCSNINYSEASTYYPVLNCHIPAEPVSLPVYPFTYPNFSYPSAQNVIPNTLGGTLTKSNFSPSNVSMTNVEVNEYMSLPIGNLDQNDNTSKRRFSDPGLPNDSDSSTNSFDARLFHKLTQQINQLKESNRKLNREMLELRTELNILKQQHTARHFEYEPGMLADVIREVRDAARVREDALLARVKHMIEEKQFTLNQLHMVAEKNRNNDRIAKLEDQMKNLSMNHSRFEDNVSLPTSSLADDGPNAAKQVIELEREALALRRELQDARAKKEESDQKLLQLDRKYSALLRQNDTASSETTEDAKTNTPADNVSVTTASLSPHVVQRVTLSGPVTDL